MITHYINTLIQVMLSPFGVIIAIFMLLSILWGIYEVWTCPSHNDSDWR